MSSLIDYIKENIQKIISENFELKDNDFEQAFNNALSDISSQMSQIGLKSEIIDSLNKDLSDNFNKLINDGVSPAEAFKESFNSVDELLNKLISSDAKVNDSIDDKFNLDFANDSFSDKTLLIDQAISQGMSVEEAVKFVNNNMYSNDSQYGPPNLADINQNATNDKNIVKSDEEENLDKIEADMDDHASRLKSAEETIFKDINKESFDSNTIENPDSDDVS